MKKRKLLFSSLLTLMLMMVCGTASYAGQKQVIPTDVSKASSDCVLMELEGSYIADIDAALDRMNEIRLEACNEGVENPATHKPLKKSDYVPLKWSEDLEYIARIRAAESALTMDHVRTNGDICVALTSPNGVRSHSEVLAWNSWSDSMVTGVNQWYEEKYDWVHKTGEETGHYESIIDPTNYYVGLGCFVSEKPYYYNTTAGEFNSSSGLSEKKGTEVKDCLQVLEIKKSALTGDYKLSGKSKLSAGKTASFTMTGTVAYEDYWGGNLVTEGLIVKDPGYSSSDPSVVSIDQNGKAKGISCGSAVIKATDSLGNQVTKKVTVPHAETELTPLKPAGIKYAGETASTACPLCGQVLTQAQQIPAIKTIKLSADAFTYNGESQKPEVSVTDENGNPVNKDYYKISYSSKSSSKVGSYSITVTFKGNYEGSKKLTYTIKPKKTSIKSLSPSAKAFTVNWKKITTQVTGYQIRYSLTSSMEDAKTVTIKENSVTSKKVSKLKSKKKYYVQIRTYKTVNDKKYYSSWSGKKTVTTK